jgi:hypothetical protein
VEIILKKEKRGTIKIVPPKYFFKGFYSTNLLIIFVAIMPNKRPRNAKLIKIAHSLPPRGVISKYLAKGVYIIINWRD